MKHEDSDHPIIINKADAFYVKFVSDSFEFTY